MWETSRRGLRLAGFSIAENLVALLILGGLVGIFIANVAAVLPHVAQSEALTLSTHSRVEWAETWANDGVLAPADTPVYEDEIEGKYVFSGDPQNDGGVTFVMNERFPTYAGEAITLRPAFSDGDAPFSVAWVCGRAPPPNGFTIRGANYTTLARERLVAACRTKL